MTKEMIGMLKVENLNVHYGVIQAIENVSIEVNDGEIVTLIGANGAGKTTILHTITGLKKATSGLVFWDDINLLEEQPSKIITHGVAHVPEGRHIFMDMTVRENLEMGAYVYSRKDKDKIAQRMDIVFEKFPRLKERQNQLAGTFSGGEQQMLAVGRALMADPKIILMDEPSMGLSPLLVQEIFSIIKEVNNQGITILLVEQNAKMALKIANRGYVLETGKIKLSGDAKELLRNDEVRKAYLGG
jgi:branched-chain amino acid transport system ATP-binding protein